MRPPPSVLLGLALALALALLLPAAPADAAGTPLPLDQAVRVSAQCIFDTLQTNTDPTFQVNNTCASGSCGALSLAGPDASTAGSAEADAGSAPGAWDSAGVQVLLLALVPRRRTT